MVGVEKIPFQFIQNPAGEWNIYVLVLFWWNITFLYWKSFQCFPLTTVSTQNSISLYTFLPMFLFFSRLSLWISSDDNDIRYKYDLFVSQIALCNSAKGLNRCRSTPFSVSVVEVNLLFDNLIQNFDTVLIFVQISADLDTFALICLNQLMRHQMVELVCQIYAMLNAIIQKWH